MTADVADRPDLLDLVDAVHKAAMAYASARVASIIAPDDESGTHHAREVTYLTYCDALDALRYAIRDAS